MIDRLAIGVLLMGLATAALPALAGDGRLEINQACIATGCFPGDSPGFPVETQQASSYVLTSNLVVANANSTAISLAEAATLDLNGFAISGVTSCTGTPVTSCAPTGTGTGIYTAGRGTVRNGTVRRMGQYGVAGGGQLLLDSVLVEENGADGVYLNYSSDGPEGHLIRNCRILRNGSSGIFESGGGGGVGTLVTGNVIYGNKTAGVAGSRVQLTNNTLARNGSVGSSGAGGYPNALGGNSFLFNNGGNDQPQTSASDVQIAPNLCGTNTTCP